MDKFKDELDLSRFTMLSNFGPDGKEAQILTSDMHLVEMINDVVIYYFEQVKELEDRGTYEEGYTAGFDNGYSERGRGL